MTKKYAVVFKNRPFDFENLEFSNLKELKKTINSKIKKKTIIRYEVYKYNDLMTVDYYPFASITSTFKNK